MEPQVPAGAPPDCRPVCKPCTPSCTHPREALPGQPPSQITARPPANLPNPGTGAPPLTPSCQAPAHPPGAHNPTCKGPVQPASPLPPASPTGRSYYTPGAGPATLARRGPGHTHGRPRDLAGRGEGAGLGRRGRRRPLPPLPRQPPPSPFPPEDLRPRRPAGKTPRAGPSRPEQLLRSREPSATSPCLGASSAALVGRVPQEPMAAACAGDARQLDWESEAGGQHRGPKVSPLAGASRAQPSAAAARLRTERAAGEGGAANERLRSLARP